MASNEPRDPTGGGPAPPRSEEEMLRSVALQNAAHILAARRRAEEELQRAKAELEEKTALLDRSLAMMRATLESTTDGIVVTDRGGRITGFNEKYGRMWNITSGLVEGGNHGVVLDAVAPQLRDPEGFRARIREIYAIRPLETHDVLEFADGRVFERTTRIQFVESENVGRVWCFRDITLRRQAEEALREEKDHLELLNRTGTMLASELDLETVVQAVTDAATRLSGAAFGAFFYNTSDERGDSYMLFTLSGAPRTAFEKFGHPRATTLFGPTFRGEGPIRIADVRADPRYGRMPPHHGMPPGHLPVRSYLAVPVISRSGAVIGGLFFGHPEVGVFSESSEQIAAGIASQAAIAIDNARLYETAQRAAEERSRLLESERRARAEAERTSALKDEFLATLSHELRTPLSAILGWSMILRHRRPDPADLEQGLQTIERNARVQTRLIEDLLDMSRITSGKVRLDIQPVEPVVAIEAAIETVKPAADAKGIRLEKLLDPDAGPVHGDPNRLQQVIWNLLSNAIKFTPRGGKVQVVLQRVNSHLEISVADSGIGIRPEFLGFVFDRFRQADASTTRAHGGLGLGLSIVKNLVELHGGTVAVASAGEGQGATFTVRLPLTPLRQAPAGATPRRHPRGPEPVEARITPCDLRGVRVLVVDDEPDARDLIRRVLEDCQAEVHTVESGEEALGMIETLRPHVLVSDIGMPVMDGYDLLRRVRQLGAERGGTVPAVALTAFARSEDRTRALRAGYLVHVSKPVEPSELIATIASVVGRTGESAAEAPAR